MSYQNILEETGRQSELMMRETERMLSAMRDTEQMMRETEQMLSTHQQLRRDAEVMRSILQTVIEDARRQSELTESFRKQVRQEIEQMESAREQMRRVAEIIMSAHQQLRWDAKIMAPTLNTVMEEVRRQSELKWFIVNQVLESGRTESAKSTTPNVSHYCRKWDWELYPLTDYYWYYCQQSLFGL